MPDTEFGSDGQIHDVDKPAAPIPAEEFAIKPAASVDPFKASEPGAADQHPVEPVPDNAKTRLRAFEDETFGKDCGRINGEVERGVGSPYARMTPAQKRQHAALEHVIVAEKKVADASAELASAEAAHEAAVKHVDASVEAAEPDPSKFGG